MRYDEHRCLVREIQEWPSGCGDSAAETCRAIVLGDSRGRWAPFVFDGGFLRHPSLKETWGGIKDFSGDQFIPLALASNLDRSVISRSRYKIHGTNTLLAPAAWFLVRRMFVAVNICNIIQGLILSMPYRWSDSKRWFEKSDGSVADFLNYLCVYFWLRDNGHWATLNQPKERCMKAVRKYYLDGDDFEPNSQWIVEMYQLAIIRTAVHG